MENEHELHFEQTEVLALAERFEQMLEANRKAYFDVVELEAIINHFLDSEDFEKADLAVAHGMALHPHSVEMKLRHAQVLLENGHDVRSIELLEAIEQLEPSNSEIYINKGAAYLHLGHKDMARSQFDKALSLGSDEEEEMLYQIASLYEQYSHYGEAIEMLRKAVALNGDHAQALYDLAYCHQRQESLELSIRYYNMFLDRDPFSESAWYNLGIVHNRLQQYGKAIECYDFVLALNDKHAYAHFNKANSLVHAGQYPPAIQCYKEYIELEEDNSQAFCYIGDCYDKMGYPDRAVTYYQKTISLDKNFSDAWHGLGMVHFSKGNYPDAIHHFERAAQINEYIADYWNALGNAYAHAGQHEKAIRAFQRNLALDDQDHEAWLNYSLLLVKQGQAQAARDLLMEALLALPKNAPLLYRLAAYCFLADDRALSLEFLRGGLAIDPQGWTEFTNFCPQARTDKDVLDLIQGDKQSP